MLYNLLVGEWSLEKLYLGNLYKGNAMWYGLDGAGALIYHEDISIVNGRCSYLYYCMGDRKVEKCFLDGRSFLLLDFKNDQDIIFAKATHKCNMDVYKATFYIYSKNSMTIKYNVQGPKKNYEVTNIYSRKKH